uniref:Attacin C-terminal domain-containing protein n=1 Tax=Timema monikensis TaxID=170555 RepID=A0A7R9DYS1_9NEOP|nr:unnamed protein product [Timema monikensis]
MITSTFLLVLVLATAIPGALLVVMPIQQMYYSVPPFYGDEVYQTVPQGTWDDAILEESLKVVLSCAWEVSRLTQHARVRRQSVKVDATHSQGGGTLVSAQGAGTVWRSGDRQAQVDLNGHASRLYGGPGGNSPPTFGGGASYNHNNRGGVGVDVSRTPGFGTQVSAQGEANLWRSRNGMTSLGATGSYSRNYGGPSGTGRPNYGGFLNFNHRF